MTATLATFAMDFDGFLGLFQITIPTWKTLDGAAYSEIVAELSKIREKAQESFRETVAFSIMCSDMAVQAERSLDSGVDFDLEQLANRFADYERSLGVQREQTIGKFDSLSREIMRRFPGMPNPVPEICNTMVATLDKQIDDLRQLRFLCMALEAEKEDDGSGIVLKSPEEIRNFFQSFS